MDTATEKTHSVPAEDFTLLCNFLKGKKKFCFVFSGHSANMLMSKIK